MAKYTLPQAQDAIEAALPQDGSEVKYADLLAELEDEGRGWAASFLQQLKSMGAVDFRVAHDRETKKSTLMVKLP